MDSAEAYEVHAREFLRTRDNSPIGTHVVAQWSRNFPTGATVIELACGGGYPITRILNHAGLRLWAVDSSPTLTAAFQFRFPTIPTQCATVQESNFFNRRYDGAIAIGLIFLLSESDQAALISRVSNILVLGGRFLFMAPTQKAHWRDMNTGIKCRSLGQARYEELLGEAGFQILGTFSDRETCNYYDVKKVRLA